MTQTSMLELVLPIQCRACGNNKFNLQFSKAREKVDRKRSIIATCDCGRVMEYVGVEEAIEMTPKFKEVD